MPGATTMDAALRTAAPRGKRSVPMSTSRRSASAIAEAAMASAAALVASMQDDGAGGEPAADGGTGGDGAAVSRKKKRRLKSDARREQKLRQAGEKLVGSYHAVTVESLAPAPDEASAFMRKRLKRQKRRMDIQSNTTLGLFKARRETGKGFRGAAEVSHEAMKLFGMKDPKGQHRTGKRLKGAPCVHAGRRPPRDECMRRPGSSSK